ncbi:Hypothetical protein HDN1F_26710 [gamma proteobacterium HdN1]|nr:Hypothetical protein HDN1F_26710 [gamma proteobacterium HdN1]
MSDQLLTRCPHCGTTFRLSQEHLRIAGGAVRCGACYQVFHANDSIIKSAEVENLTPPAPPPTPPKHDPVGDFSFDDAGDLDSYGDSNNFSDITPYADLDESDLSSYGNLDGPRKPQIPSALSGTHSASTRPAATDGQDEIDDYHQKLLLDHPDSGFDFGVNVSSVTTNTPDPFDTADESAPKSNKGKAAKSEDWARQMLAEMGESIDDEEEESGEPEDNFTIRKAPASRTGFSNITSDGDLFSDDDSDSSRPSAPTKKASSARSPSNTKRIEDELSDSFRNLGVSGFSADDLFNLDDLKDDDEAPESDMDEAWAKAMLRELEGDSPEPEKPSSGSPELSLEELVPDHEPVFGARALSRNKDEAIRKARERSALAPALDAPKTSKGKASDNAVDDGQEIPQQEKDEKLFSSFSTDFLSGLDDPNLDISIENINLDDAIGALQGFDAKQSRANLEKASRPKTTHSTDSETTEAESLSVKEQLSPAEIAANVRAQAALYDKAHAPRSRPIRTALVTLSILALIATFIVQIAYFKLDELSRLPELRPYYIWGCAKLGCQLPDQIDTHRIRGTNLVVRSHPKVAKALSVDFMITNDAPFAQPFPIIELAFENDKGETIASRGFLPKEYINDPAIDISQMPPHTPFHIGLEIVDPGANHYRLNFLPPPGHGAAEPSTPASP